MRKRTFLAILMAAILLMTAGCSLIVKDEEIDKQTVIAEVAGKTLLKGDFMTDYNEQLAIQTSYGYDMTSAENKAQLQQSLIDVFVQNAVLDQKLKENDMETLDDATLSEVTASAKETYDSYYELMKTYYFSGSELTGDALDAAIKDAMAQQGIASEEALTEQSIRTKQYNLLLEKFTADVTVTDEELQTEYDTRVSEAKTSYETTLTQYSTDVSGEKTIYYRPAGYRYVKNLLVKLLDEDSAAITELNSQISTKNTALTTATSTITDYESAKEEDVAALDEDAKAARETAYAEAKASKETLDKELAELNTQLTEKKAAAYAAIMPTVEEIQTKLAAGESFDALLETYGQDTGMTVSPAKEQGYLLCTGLTRYVAAFTEAGMALEKIGDVSAPVESSYGYHLIQYTSDVPEGAVALDDVKETLSAEMLSTKKSEAFNTIFQQWITDANAKIDLNALK